EDPVKLLRHCLGYLGHPDRELADDACMELSRSRGKHLRVAARGFPAERVASWLQEPRIGNARRNAYGLLLGYCGQARHADLLRQTLGEELNHEYVPSDHLLVGYTMLR